MEGYSDLPAEAPPPYSELPEQLDVGAYSRSTSQYSLDSVNRYSLGATAQITLRRDSEALLPNPKCGERLTFCDFLPDITTVFNPDQQETFSCLLMRANVWLSCNPTWRVKGCEIIQVLVGPKNQGYQSEVFYDDLNKECTFVQGLRFWLTSLDMEEDRLRFRQPEIGMVNLVAQSAPITNSKGQQVVAFENISQLLQRHRDEWSNNPISGHILCVNTSKTLVGNLQSFNPDTTVFKREKLYKPNVLDVLRVFYECGEPEEQNVEIADFLPVTTIPMLGSVQRESFSQVFKTASDWLKKNCWAAGHRFLNIQTLEVEVRPGGRTDTSRLWSASETKKEFFVRYLRAAYVTGPTKEFENLEAMTDMIPIGRTLPPLPLKGSTSSKLSLEPLFKCRERLEAWVKATQAKVLCVETVWLRSPTIEDTRKTSESSATLYSGRRYRYLAAVRLYLHKEYVDPPLQMLPALPTGSNSSCSIS